MFSKQNEKAEIKHSKTMNWLRSRGKRHKIPCSNDIKQFSISVSASRISTKNSSRLILNSFYTMDEITEVNVLYEKLSRSQRNIFCDVETTKHRSAPGVYHKSFRRLRNYRVGGSACKQTYEVDY